MKLLSLLLLFAACFNGPQLYRCHETSSCDDVPSDEGTWSVCTDDVDAYGRDIVLSCSSVLIGWCTWYTCQATCERIGDCPADDAGIP